jgi:rhamnosyltransferase
LISNSTRIAILLALHNGENWIKSQLDTILGLSDVDIGIYISDDCSSDSSKEIVSSYIKKYPVIKILESKHLGSACENFFRLLKESDFDLYDFIALSDQDDIWLPEKLNNAINTIIERKVEAYSGNVTAFWPNGKKKIINKAQQQQQYDYMFESAGPGCTFVLTKKLAIDLQKFLIMNQEKCKGVALHDWFIYAFARSHGYSWFIDKEPHMLYRQHDTNLVGANIGIKAKFARWEKMREGWHVKQALLIADILGYSNSFPIKELKNYSFVDRVLLIANVRKLRRRLRDCFALAIFFLFPLKK